jgi:hypothetical protein
VGKPVPVTLVHVSPPSVDFHNALPGPPPFMQQAVRRRWYMLANITFGSLGDSADAFQFHYDTYELPENAVLMGEANGMVEAFKVGSSAWATQFHPEVGLSQQLAWLSTYSRAFAREGIDLEEQIAKSHALAASYRKQAWDLSAAFAKQVLAFHSR